MAFENAESFEKFLLSLIGSWITVLGLTYQGGPVEGTLEQVFVSKESFKYVKLFDGTNMFCVGLHPDNFKVKIP